MSSHPSLGLEKLHSFSTCPLYVSRGGTSEHLSSKPSLSRYLLTLQPIPLSRKYSSSPKPFELSTMAERNPSQQRAPGPNPTATTSTFLRKIQAQAPNSTQLLGFLTLFISASILLILTGITVTATILGFIFFMPLILISIPLWFPVGTVLFVTTAGFLSACGFGVMVAAGLSWMYRYLRGMHPPGSDRVDYARSRIFDTASHVKDYAMEYGGYLQSKVKDAAPGA
ncbi:oleosin 1-like [Durio zibethinus]|uniref:Oleosin 1-like n=1 Tax=Durio zibethinus TaxID=66656 RepID=A0A6P5Y402_DURZI|nr:oleosin 1-like [Durio zibethinus]